MTLFSELIETPLSPILIRAVEAMGIMQVKLDIAAKNLISYGNTEDLADLVAVERVLTEMKTEIDHARQVIATEINREDEKVSIELAKKGPFDQENPS